MTSIGIPMYAVKEISKLRDDKIQRDKTTIEIIGLSFCLCIIGYVAVLVIAQLVPQVHEQSSLFYILSLTILFTALGVNWFYQGIEDFKFITVRAIIVRTLAAASLFAFVKNSSDLLIYGWILVGSTVGNNIINFLHLRKHIKINFLRIKELNFLKHLKPALHVFILNIIISLYIQLNSVMLGFLSGDEAVGLFTAGTKISHIGLSIISSFATVLLPRCSNLIKSGDSVGFNKIINKSLGITLALSLPMTLGLMILAAPLTIIFCGEEYFGAIPVLLLNAPVVIFISLTNLMGIQILYPKDKINIVIWSVTGGAIMNLILNFILIPNHGAVGAAISTLVAEFTVLLFQIYWGRKYYPFEIKQMFNFIYILGSIIMGISVYLSIVTINSLLLKIVVGVSVGTIVYITFLFLVKDPIFTEAKDFILNKFKYAKETL